MEFLFLNESAEENKVDELKVFLQEEMGFTLSEDFDNKSLSDVMLEAEEGIHEAEMTAMQEEFSLFQESTVLNEEEAGQEKKDAWYKRAWEQIKKWWEAIVKWLSQTWLKILHWYDAAVNSIRKAIQSAIMKVTGRKEMTIPENLKGLEGDPYDAARDLWSEIMNSGSVEKGKEIVNSKLKDLVKKPELSEKKVTIQFAEWKKLVDSVVTKIDSARKNAITLKKQYLQVVRENDAKLKQLSKDASKETKEEIVKKGKLLKYATMAQGKVCSKITSYYRWYASKLFTASRSVKKEEKK